MSPKVFRVSVRDGEGYVGWLASYFNVPGLFGSVIHQSANYIGVGPTFPSSTKQFDTFPGLDLLRSVAAEIRLPAFAIGGITQENLSEVLATGVTRVAASGEVTTAGDPAATAGELLSAIISRQ